jgi:molybdopterin synthase sulfur carrier subunit
MEGSGEFMPRVEVPSRYRVPTQGESSIDVSADTVRGCIDAVEARYPGFRKLIIDSKGSLNRFVSLFVNGEAIARSDLDVPLSPADSLEIVAAAAGG